MPVFWYKGPYFKKKKSTVGSKFEGVEIILLNRIKNIENFIDVWGYVGLVTSVLSSSGEQLLFVTISRLYSWLRVRFSLTLLMAVTRRIEKTDAILILPQPCPTVCEPALESLIEVVHCLEAKLPPCLPLMITRN